MQRPFKFTKLKLITGYILILLLGAIAIIFIYKQTIALTTKGNDEVVMQRKLFIISNTLAKLYSFRSEPDNHYLLQQNFTRQRTREYLSRKPDLKRTLIPTWT